MLRFVWWPEGDLSAELQEYQMCVHLFGGTHSPSTCNYALRKTAKDNMEEFGEEAASTLIKNFYVDDMLKSAPDVPSTLHLLKNVKQMLCSWWFPSFKIRHQFERGTSDDTIERQVEGSKGHQLR